MQFDKNYLTKEQYNNFKKVCKKSLKENHLFKNTYTVLNLASYLLNNIHDFYFTKATVKLINKYINSEKENLKVIL